MSLFVRKCNFKNENKVQRCDRISNQRALHPSRDSLSCCLQPGISISTTAGACPSFTVQSLPIQIGGIWCLRMLSEPCTPFADQCL